MADGNSPVPRQMHVYPLEVSGLPSCNTEPVKAEESHSLLASVALMPSCDKPTHCSCLCDVCMDQAGSDAQEEREIDLHWVNLQQHFFITKADDILKNFVEGIAEGESLAASLPSFLFTSKPYFNYLESTARNTLNEKIPLSESTCSRLLDFSETLVDKLENLLLTFSSNGFISLDETESNSISHFHIGQCEVGSMKVNIFRYCLPTPYLGQVNTGLYKRMRWNVDKMEDATQQQKEESDIDDTEFYFLCFEDVNLLTEGDSGIIPHSNVVRVWSIGQWIQASPDTDDIEDWVLCRVPQGIYLKRVILGTEEPSCRVATDNLLELLILDQKTSSQ